jgi:hypothetical protein
MMAHSIDPAIRAAQKKMGMKIVPEKLPKAQPTKKKK